MMLRTPPSSPYVRLFRRPVGSGRSESLHKALEGRTAVLFDFEAGEPARVPPSVAFFAQATVPTILALIPSLDKGSLVALDGIQFLLNGDPEPLNKIVFLAEKFQIHLWITWLDPRPVPKTWAEKVRALPKGVRHRTVSAGHRIARERNESWFGRRDLDAAFYALFYDEETWEKAYEEVVVGVDGILDDLKV